MATINNDVEPIDEITKIESIITHIQMVQSNCEKLGKKLILNGHSFLGRMLIYNGFQHDVSKFMGVEWEFLHTKEVSKLKGTKKNNFIKSLEQHQLTNKHHPEYWGGIHNMPDVHIAEMVCDLVARSAEFGTNVREWIDNNATKKFGFKKGDDVYNKIMKYIDLLLDKPFENVK